MTGTPGTLAGAGVACPHAFTAFYAPETGDSHPHVRSLAGLAAGRADGLVDASIGTVVDSEPRACAARALAGLDDDLSDVLAVCDAGRYPVFSPGDICPDNNLLTGHGLRVFDFECASYHSALFDAAYTVMPFATCWCVYRLPPQIRHETEAAFRGEVVAPYPDLGDDEVWRPGLRRAAALWTIDMTVLILLRVGSEDRPVHPVRRPLPTMRQLLHYRWQWLAAELESTYDLPALAQAMRGLLEATEPLERPADARLPAPAVIIGVPRSGPDLPRRRGERWLGHSNLKTPALGDFERRARRALPLTSPRSMDTWGDSPGPLTAWRRDSEARRRCGPHRACCASRA